MVCVVSQERDEKCGYAYDSVVINVHVILNQLSVVHICSPSPGCIGRGVRDKDMVCVTRQLARRSTPRCRRCDYGIGCSKRCGAHIASRESNSQVCSQHHRGMCSPALNPLSSVATLTLSLGAIRRDESAFCTTFERVDFTTTRVWRCVLRVEGQQRAIKEAEGKEIKTWRGTQQPLHPVCSPWRDSPRPTRASSAQGNGSYNTERGRRSG